MKLHFFLIALCVFACQQPQLQDGLQIVFSKSQMATSVCQPQPCDDPPAEQKTEGQVVVTLLPHQLVVREDPIERRYDFNSRTVTHIDHGAKNYARLSLYAFAGFYDAEFKNRIMLSQALLQCKGCQTHYDIYNTESLYSIRDQTHSAWDQIVESAEGDRTVFRYNDREVVSYHLTDQIITEADLPLFEKFVIYATNLHPRIRESLVKQKHLFGDLHYIIKDGIGPENDIRLKLLSVSKVSVAFESSGPKGFVEKAMLPVEWNDILNQVKKGASVVARQRSDLQAYVENAVAKKVFFDAVLAYYELSLQAPLQSSTAILQSKAQFQQDPNYQLFVQADQAFKQGDYAGSIELYSKIDRTGLTKDYIIDVMAATAFMRNSDFENARILYLKALRKDPYLTGVYHDLGFMFYKEYEMEQAWACFDIARRLSPEFKMLSDIDQLESYLVSQHPQLF